MRTITIPPNSFYLSCNNPQGFGIYKTEAAHDVSEAFLLRGLAEGSERERSLHVSIARQIEELNKLSPIVADMRRWLELPPDTSHPKIGRVDAYQQIQTLLQNATSSIADGLVAYGDDEARAVAITNLVELWTPRFLTLFESMGGA